MRKKRVILLCLIAATLVLIAFLAHNPTPAEPSYDGHPLSYWVNVLGTPGSMRKDRRDEAANAIDQIGVAGIPFLVKWIQDEPPRWKFQLYSRLARARLPLADRLGHSLTRAHQLVEGSRFAFQSLGETAMPAFHDLCRLVNETNTPFTAYAAITALSGFGTNALPPLLAVAANTNHPFHIQAQLTASKILSGYPPFQ